MGQLLSPRISKLLILTVCQILKAFILDLELQWVGDFARVVKHVDISYVDGHFSRLIF
jgi:hypothetical protein